MKTLATSMLKEGNAHPSPPLMATISRFVVQSSFWEVHKLRSLEMSEDPTRLRAELDQTKLQLAEVLDEILFVEGEKKRQESQREQCEMREHLAMAACENLLSYLVHLEKDVLLAALAGIGTAFSEFHAVADARRRGEVSAEAAVNVASNLRMAQIFQQMKSNSNELSPTAVAAMQKVSLESRQQRERVLGAAVTQGVPFSFEDAFLLCNAFIAAKDNMKKLVTDTAKALEEQRHKVLESHAEMSASPHPQAPWSSNKEKEELESRIASLTAEVQRLQASARGKPLTADESTSYLAHENESLRRERALLEEQMKTRATAAAQETQLVALRADTVAKQLSKVTEENNALRMRLDAFSSQETLNQQVLQERAQLQQRVAVLEQLVAQNNSDRLAVAQRFETLQKALEGAQSTPHFSAMASDGSFGSSLAATASLHATIQQQIVEINRLRAALDKLQTESSSMKEASEGTIMQLRKKMVELQQHSNQEIASQNVDSTLRMLQGGGSPASDTVAAILGKNESQKQQQHDQQTKLKAFEMTVAALNAELAALEDKVVGMERQHQEEKAQLVSSFDEERKRVLAEQAECDTVVNRITNELETLMKENAQLKQRLRAVAAA